MSTITRLRGDMAIVKVDAVASRLSSTIILEPDNPPRGKERTEVYWGTLRMAGDGRIITTDDGSGLEAPSILDCPGFHEGCRVLFLQRFHHQGAAPHLDDHEVMIHDFDILACVDPEGHLRPAWGYTLIDSPRQQGTPRPAFTGSSILIIDKAKSYADRPLATGEVKTIAPIYAYKGETRNITGRIKEFWGLRAPSFKPGDHVVFGRYAGWRVFADKESRDDNMMLVPTKDVLSIIDENADFECLDVEDEGTGGMFG